VCVKNRELNFYAKKELSHHPAKQTQRPDKYRTTYDNAGCLIQIPCSIVVIVIVVPLMLIVIRSHRMVQACIRIPACLFVSHFLTPITLLTAVSTLVRCSAVAAQGVSSFLGERTWRSCSQSLLPCHPPTSPTYMSSGSPSNDLGRSSLRRYGMPTGARISLPAHPQTSLYWRYDEP